MFIYDFEMIEEVGMELPEKVLQGLMKDDGVEYDVEPVDKNNLPPIFLTLKILMKKEDVDRFLKYFAIPENMKKSGILEITHTGV